MFEHQKDLIGVSKKVL